MHICRLAGDDGVGIRPNPVDRSSDTVTPTGVDSSTTEPVRCGGIDLLASTERHTTIDPLRDDDKTIWG